jgi:hypothetical protein
MDPDHKTLIRITMHDNWGIDHPHKFQICAIHCTAFHRTELLYIIAKTGSGKSASPLTVGMLLTGVVITLVSLVGHGSDQVTKALQCGQLRRSLPCYLEAYHVDDHRGKDAAKLRHCLDT